MTGRRALPAKSRLTAGARHAAALPFACSLLACGSSTPGPAPRPPASDASGAPAIDAAPATDVATPDSAVASVDAAAANPFAGYPPRLAPAGNGCVVTGEWRSTEQPTRLALAPKRKPFARVFQVQEASATLAGDTAFVEATTKAIRIAGYVDARAVRLHATQPFLVAGWLAPGPRASLPFVSERDGQVTFEVPPPEGVKAKAAVRGTRPCADLGTDATAEFSARDVVGESIETMLVRAKRTVPLSIERGKPAVAQLRYKESPSAHVLEKQGTHARVVVNVGSLNPANDIVVVGWVPLAALESESRGFGGSWGSGGEPGIPREPPRPDAKHYKCAAEIGLAVEHAGERLTIGTITPGFVVEALPGADDFVEVKLPGAPVSLLEGARWLVSRAALAGCAEVTRP